MKKLKKLKPHKKCHTEKYRKRRQKQRANRKVKQKQHKLLTTTPEQSRPSIEEAFGGE